MADQYEELRRAIEAAQTATDAIGEPWYGPDAGMGVIYIDPTGPAGRADFDYIAAANPQTIAALLAELDALREDARRMREALMAVHIDAVHVAGDEFAINRKAVKLVDAALHPSKDADRS